MSGTIALGVNRVRESSIFYSGDEITGVVEIIGSLPFPDHKDSKVVVTFSGSSNAAHWMKGHVWKDEAMFFQYEKVLFIGTLNLTKGDHQSWNFAFRLPEQTEPSDGRAEISRKKRYESWLMTPHPLPPSAVLSGQCSQEWRGIISYTLHAKVSGKWGWREDRRIITVLPKAHNDIPTELSVQSKEFTHSSSRLLAEESQRRRSLSKWFSDKVASNTPKAVFSIKASTLQTLTPGQHIPIHLQVDYNSEKSNLSSFPDLRLLDVKYNIMAKTDVWGDEFMSTATSRELAGRFGPKDNVYAQYLTFDSHFLVNGQNIEIDKYTAEDGQMYHISLDRVLVPPFKSYNLARSYEVVLSVSFEGGGRKFEAKFSWPLDITANENYIAQGHVISGIDESEDVKAVGKMILHGAVTLAEAVMGG